MKKKYIKPEMEIKELIIEDIITSSLGETPVNQTVVNNDPDSNPTNNQGETFW